MYFFSQPQLSMGMDGVQVIKGCWQLSGGHGCASESQHD